VITADLWYVPTSAIDGELADACRALLAPDETARVARFHFERHRHEHLVTRALARAVLATYVGRPPATLSFVRTGYGRPLLVGAGPLEFNLTNTTELVACAVAHDRRIGVDAEPLARADRVLDVAPTVFTSAEQAGLAALSPAARERRAVELWTLKEAYMKARGLGMSLPVERFEVVHEAGARSLRFHPPIEDPSRWELTTFELEQHLVSTCIDLGDATASDLRVEVRRADLAALLSTVAR
jgi:4'-phosphopantetheinyl transferase